MANMYQLLECAAIDSADSVFITREGITYGNFLEMVKARATTLKKMGVKHGDAVGLLSHNIKEWPITAFAIWALGARALLLDTNLTKFEYENMTERTECKLVVCEKNFIYKTDKVKFYDIKTPEVINQETYEFVADEVSADEIATLSFTSGSTGTPKIVPLTHYNLTETSSSLQMAHNFISMGDVLYGFLPLYHVFGFAVGLLATIHYRGSILLQPTVNPKEILADFAKFRPHIIPSVPRMFEIFRNKIIDQFKKKHIWWFASFILKFQHIFNAVGLGFLVKKLQTPILQLFGGRVRLLIAGGAATKPEVELFYNRFGFKFIQGFGLTETVGPITLSLPHKGRLPFAIGVAIPNNEFEIRNKDENGIGVLWMRGHSVFNGYLNNEAATKEAFDENGFFNTGDLASVDKNGELHFHGRKKLIIVLDSGKNVYPDELEGLFIEIPGVKNVAVFEHKVKDKTVVYGVFQVEEGTNFDELAKAISKENAKVASYKWCTHFAMTTDELPMTSTTKIKHHEVRRMLESGSFPTRKE
jgi:long-chain acyl-CoA synthetase